MPTDAIDIELAAVTSRTGVAPFLRRRTPARRVGAEGP